MQSNETKVVIVERPPGAEALGDTREARGNRARTKNAQGTSIHTRFLYKQSADKGGKQKKLIFGNTPRF